MVVVVVDYAMAGVVDAFDHAFVPVTSIERL